MCEWALKMPLPTQLSVSRNQLFKNGGEVIERGILTGFPPQFLKLGWLEHLSFKLSLCLYTLLLLLLEEKLNYTDFSGMVPIPNVLYFFLVPFKEECQPIAELRANSWLPWNKWWFYLPRRAFTLSILLFSQSCDPGTRRAA